MKIVATLAVVASLTGASAVKVTLTAPTHSPQVNTRWNYSVKATQNGKPAAARLTAQIVDPTGAAHAVQYGSTKRNVTNWPFKGTFRDYVTWPASARGIPLTFRVTVKVGTTKKVIRYAVTPH